MDSQQPENCWLHLFCPRWIDDYHPSMRNPVDVATSHKLTAMQGEQKINKSMAQVSSTCPPKNSQPNKKNPNPCECLVDSQVPEPILRVGGLGLVLMMRPLTSAENDCSRKIQDEKSHLAIPRHLNNSL